MGLEDRLMPFEYYQLHLNNNLPCLERIAGPLQEYTEDFFFFKGYAKTLKNENLNSFCSWWNAIKRF